MKNKIISFIVWLIVWIILVQWYSYFFKSDSLENNMPENPTEWRIMNNSSPSDEQLEKISERTWISVDELKEKIDSWEDLRSIMWWTKRKSQTSSWNLENNWRTWSWAKIN